MVPSPKKDRRELVHPVPPRSFNLQNLSLSLVYFFGLDSGGTIAFIR
jgi:hypothetical protein